MTNKEPATHICTDGVMRPGKGRFGKGTGRCAKCWNAYLAERRRRGDEGIAIKHGFYRKKLTPDEAKLAERLHRQLSKEYGLNGDVDDILLHQLVTNLLKSTRVEPDRPGDHNIRDAQSYRERQVREAMEALNLTRRQRKEEDGKGDPMREALASLFGAKKEAARQATADVPDDLKPAP